MKKFFLMKLVVLPLCAVLTAMLTGGCATKPGGGAADPCKQARYDGKAMEPYAEPIHHFKICLPKGLTGSGPAKSATERVVISGFAVPPGTNLEAKTLVIVPGHDDDLQGATPMGQFVAGGVTFKRVQLDEGSAGHTTLHVAYVWTMKGKKLTFDFVHRAVNPLVFDPDKRPAEYDRAKQIKLTEEIMGTFRRTE